MDPGGAGSGLQRRQTLAQEGNQEPCQYIAAAAGGHAGVAGAILISPGSIGHHSPVTLQEDHRPQRLGQSRRRGHPIRSHRPSQAAKLPIVGRENGGSPPRLEGVRRPLQHVQPVGIQDHWAPGLPQHRLRHRPDPGRPAQARAHQTGVTVRQTAQNLRYCRRGQPVPLCRQGKHHRLIQLHRFYGIDGLRNPQKHQSGSGPDRSPSRQSRRSGVPHAAAQKQKLSKVPLVPPRVPVRKPRRHCLLIQNFRLHGPPSLGFCL